MAVDENTPEVTGASTDEETPDWTTWLRSRLERVVSAERKGTDGSSDTSDAGAGSISRGQPDGDLGGDLAPLIKRIDALADATTASRELLESQARAADRLAAWMQELATTQADDERWAIAVGRVVDEVDEERRVAGERAETTLVDLADRVERIEQGLRQISDEISALGRSRSLAPGAPARLAEPQLQAIAAAVGAALVRRSGAPASLPAEPVASDPGSAGESSRADRSVPARPRRRSPLRAAPATGGSATTEA